MHSAKLKEGKYKKELQRKLRRTRMFQKSMKREVLGSA